MAQTLRIPFLLLIVISVSAQQPLPDLARADKLSAEGKHKEAARAYDEYSRVRPDDPKGYHGAALAFARIRRFNESAKRLLLALQFRPDDPAVLFDLASSLQNQGRFGEAIVHLRRLESLSATDAKVGVLPEIPFNRGLCASKLELIPEAVEALNQALRIAGDQHASIDKIRGELAGVLINAERFEEASREFKRLIQRAPSDSRSQYHLGYCYLQMGQDELAEKLLKEARRLDAKLPETSLRLGKLYARQKRLDLAYSLYSEAVEKNPLAAEGWHGLARIATEKNQPDEAAEFQKKFENAKAKQEEVDGKKRELQRRVASNPNDAAGWFEHSVMALENGALEVAQELLTHCVAVDPRHEFAILNLASIFGQRRLYQEALYELDKLLEANPDHPFANLETCRYLGLLGRHADAVTAMLRGLVQFDTKDPRYGPALEMLAEFAHVGKCLPRVATALEAGLGNLPPDSPSYARLATRFAQACAELKAHAKALPWLEAAVSVLKRDDPIRASLFKTMANLAEAAGDGPRAKRYLEEIKGQ